MAEKNTFNPNMLSSRQKQEVAETGSFRNSRGEMVRVGDAPTTNPGAPTGSNTDAIMAALTERLTNQGRGISSSASTNLQSLIGEAIAGTERAGQLTTKALQSERAREMAFANDRAGATIGAALEGRTGFATQVVALRELTETTEKSLRDLDSRYMEAIMQNDASTASRIADLKVKKLEFAMEQEQNFFSNMINMAQIVEQQLSRKQQGEQFFAGLEAEEDRFTRGQAQELVLFERGKFAQERMQMLSLAAEFGIPVGQDDTIDTIVTKVSPFVDEERRLKLEAMRAEINASNATAARALKGDVNTVLTPDELDALASAYANGNTDVAKFLETPEQLSAVLSRASTLENNRVSSLQEIARTSTSMEDFEMRVTQSGLVITQSELQNLPRVFERTWSENARRQRDANRKPPAMRPSLQFRMMPNPNNIKPVTS